MQLLPTGRAAVAVCAFSQALLGYALADIVRLGSYELRFVRTDGVVVRLHYDQAGCELVLIRSVSGDTRSVIGQPITEAHEALSDGVIPEGLIGSGEPCKLTSYTVATASGRYTVEWLGVTLESGCDCVIGPVAVDVQGPA